MSATTPLPEVLTVDEVMERYRLRDRRSARRLMDETGAAFVVGGRLLIDRADLLAHEEQLREARRAPQAAQASPLAPRRGRRSAAPRTARREPLKPDWWRGDGESESS